TPAGPTPNSHLLSCPQESPVFIPLAILATIAILGLFLSLRGRRIDDHPVCRRCKFDLIGLPHTICPECGAKLDAPNSIRTGNRRRYRRLAILSICLLLISLAGSGLMFSGNTKKIDWYTYKPVWWLRIDARRGSLDTATHAVNELIARNDNSKLTQGELDTVVSTLCTALESAHFPNPTPYASALHNLFLSGRLSSDTRERFIS